MLKAFLNAKAVISLCLYLKRTLANFHHPSTTYLRKLVVIPQYTHLEPHHLALLVTATMSLLSGGSRVFKTITSAIKWPARVQVVPFSAPDMEQTPDFCERDRNGSTSPHCKVEKNIGNVNNTGLGVGFADHYNITPDQSGTYLLGCTISIPVSLSVCKICSGSNKLLIL